MRLRVHSKKPSEHWLWQLSRQVGAPLTRICTTGASSVFRCGSYVIHIVQVSSAKVWRVSVYAGSVGSRWARPVVHLCGIPLRMALARASTLGSMAATRAQDLLRPLGSACMRLGNTVEGTCVIVGHGLGSMAAWVWTTLGRVAGSTVVPVLRPLGLVGMRLLGAVDVLVRNGVGSLTSWAWATLGTAAGLALAPVRKVAALARAVLLDGYVWLVFELPRGPLAVVRPHGREAGEFKGPGRKTENALHVSNHHLVPSVDLAGVWVMC